MEPVSGGLVLLRQQRRSRGVYWSIFAPALIPFSESGEVRKEITAQELGALLSGIDLSQAKRRKRYQRKSTEAA